MAMGGKAAMSLYGDGMVNFNRMKAILPFCSAVSKETATICGRDSLVSHAKKAPKKKPPQATQTPARIMAPSKRMKMCDKL